MARPGQALVEFALVALVTLALLLGVIQAGVLIYAGWIVLPGAVQDGAAVAASAGATPEDGRRRALDLLAAGGVGRLGRWTVEVEDLGGAVRLTATGDLPPVAPLGGATIRLRQAHTAVKEGVGDAP
jgi:hypothetical protein